MQMPFYRTHTHFHTQTLLHTDAFAHRHRRFSTQTLLHTDAFTHKRFYTYALHTDAFTRKHFYIQALLHTDAFTLRHFYTQTLFHTDPFTHRHFTHKHTFTHRRFHRDFYTETLTKRGPTGWPQLQTKVRKHSCNGNAKKIAKVHKTRLSTMINAQSMQGIRSLRYKISSAPWCRGWTSVANTGGQT